MVSWTGGIFCILMTDNTIVRMYFEPWIFFDRGEIRLLFIRIDIVLYRQHRGEFCKRTSCFRCRFIYIEISHKCYTYSTRIVPVSMCCNNSLPSSSPLINISKWVDQKVVSNISSSSVMCVELINIYHSLSRTFFTIVHL